jgi:hypothetical protein
MIAADNSIKEISERIGEEFGALLHIDVRIYIAVMYIKTSLLILLMFSFIIINLLVCQILSPACVI